ncbi:hypothetical protein ACK32R_20835 [Aeromonas dhakensis]|uniref:hypothetical protein n=1 Tax=Aeromonas dhakensis TaxID=196024 RepID=UPI0039867B0D
MFVDVHALQDTIDHDWLDWACRSQGEASCFFEAAMHPHVIGYPGFATLDSESLYLFLTQIASVCLEKFGVIEPGPKSIVTFSSPKINEQYLLDLTRHVNFDVQHASVLMDILIADFYKRSHYERVQTQQGTSNFALKCTQASEQLNIFTYETIGSEIFSISDIDKLIGSISEMVCREGEDIRLFYTPSENKKKEIATSARTVNWRYIMLLLSDIPKYQASVNRFFTEHEKVFGVFGGNRDYVEASYSIFKIKGNSFANNNEGKHWLPISNLPRIDFPTFVSRLNDTFVSITSLLKQVEHLKLSSQQLDVIYDKVALLHDTRAVSVIEWLLFQENLSKACRGKIAQDVWYDRNLPFSGDAYKLPWSVETLTLLLKDKKIPTQLHLSHMFIGCVDCTQESLHSLLDELPRASSGAIEVKKSWEIIADDISRVLIGAFYFPSLFKGQDVDEKRFIDAITINFRRLTERDLIPLSMFGINKIVDNIPELSDYMLMFNPEFSEKMTAMMLQSKLNKDQVHSPTMTTKKISRSL